MATQAVDLVMQDHGDNPNASIGEIVEEATVYNSNGITSVKKVQVDGRLLALKRLKVSCPVNDDDEETEPEMSFHMEMTLLMQLNHENVLRFVDRRNPGPGVYEIFTEFIDGKTVEQLLKERGGGLAPESVRRYCGMLCEAINHLHSRDEPVVHRNINAKNVMVTNSSDVVKLIDFGIARQLAMAGSQAVSQMYTFTHGGEDMFMAPEVVRMEKRVYSKGTDIWAFGCTLYQMCSGSRPFREARTLYGLVQSIREGAPSLPQDCGDLLKEFYASCTVVDPKDRSSAAELLRHPYLQ